ncbi:unnamed protein product [Moneuplotes crassus]|uniref:Uncharacterized protein n=1 Tax=Euplotes crassus TaxID=5936 RepID=A0AAD1XAZ6_EUPCR|nr:unnamed protein product [Moneuplotes crassus]
MEMTTPVEFDENLSDDFIDEEVSSWSIRKSDKILVNMSENSLSSKKKRKNSFIRGFKHLHFPESDKEHEEPPRLELKMHKIHSLNYQKKDNKDVGKDKEKKSNASLKQEISSLLKYAAKLRSKEMMKDCHAQQAAKDHKNNFLKDLPSPKKAAMKDMEPC